MKWASPRARRLASELGLAGVEIVGTGTGGRVTVEDVRNGAPDPPPASLGDAGRALWRGIRAKWALRPDENRLLLEACRCADEIERLTVALADSDPVVVGSRGQPRPSPLLGELRQHRIVLGRLLAQLGLKEADAQASSSGSGFGLERSAAGRSLALQRWNKGGRRV